MSAAARHDDVTIGIDFGTLSGRAVVVRVSDGAELGSGVHEYEHAVMDSALTVYDGQQLPPDWALQNPGDYVNVLKNAVPAALRDAGVHPQQVIGVGTDFTACTMVPTTADGTPLNELPQFADRPHAYTKLWRHHAAQPQADRINQAAHRRSEPWISRYGGFISSEWEFAKGLQLLEEDPEVYAAMEHWVEAADWIVWQLTGTYVRNACSAGYKGILQDGEYPSRGFLTELNPEFAGFVEDKLDHPIGQLGTGPGPQRPGRSLDRPARRHRRGSGQRGRPRHQPGSRRRRGRPDGRHHGNLHLPRHDLLAAGRSAGHVRCGRRRHPRLTHGGMRPDSPAWGHLRLVREEPGPRRLRGRSPAARAQPARAAHREGSRAAPGAHGLIALDWHSGNRSVLVDHELSGAIIGQTLATRPEEIYRALLEATAFGTRTIIEAFNAAGVPVREFVVAGMGC